LRAVASHNDQKLTAALLKRSDLPLSVLRIIDPDLKEKAAEEAIRAKVKEASKTEKKSRGAK
jgi:hypothetical protein